MSDYPSDSWPPPPPGPYSKKKKKKSMARLNTSYWLPRLDEMALLQPISTRADGASKEEKGRVETVNEQLVKYNRWLTFLPDTKPGKRVRTAASELQQSVHDLNTLIASMMIQVDQKIADLQDRTEDFVEAVQDGGTWQTTGDILGLTYEELDQILTKHPDRNTEVYGDHLYETVRRASLPHAPYCTEGFSCRFLDKIFRLVQEVAQCPTGPVKAFHLYIFAKAVILPERGDRNVYGGTTPGKWSYKKVDTEVVELVRKSQMVVRTKHSTQAWPYFNFASAKREISLKLPRWCGTCDRTPSPPRQPPGPFSFPVADPVPDPFYDPLYDTDPFGALQLGPRCARKPHLRLLEHVQKWAYGEIRSGVMLAFSKKLPRELCLNIFEFAMIAEEVPLDPRVWDEDEYLAGMCIRGGGRAATSMNSICRVCWRNDSPAFRLVVSSATPPMPAPSSWGVALCSNDGRTILLASYFVLSCVGMILTGLDARAYERSTQDWMTQVSPHLEAVDRYIEYSQKKLLPIQAAALDAL